MKRSFDLLRLLIAGGLGCQAALAQIPDPTRPAASAMPQEAGGSIASTPAANGLQAVIIRPDGKSVALIDGRSVGVGDRMGDRRVTRISEGEVVLQGAGGREVLKVVPAAEKLPIKKDARRGPARNVSQQ